MFAQKIEECFLLCAGQVINTEFTRQRRAHPIERKPIRFFNSSSERCPMLNLTRNRSTQEMRFLARHLDEFRAKFDRCIFFGRHQNTPAIRWQNATIQFGSM